MKKYKIKQTLVLSVAVGRLEAHVIKVGSVLVETKNNYVLEEDKTSIGPVFRKPDVETTPELFELVTE